MAEDDIGTLDTTTPELATLDTSAPSGATSGARRTEAVGGGGARVRYTLGAMLGKGGMGEVVSARDEQLGRSVAVKRLRAGLDEQDQIVARFVREARIQGRLDHPAIVPVHELWHDAEGRPCFAMKQLAGRTLADVIEKLAAGDAATVREFPVQRLLRAFAEVCLAIEFAHTRGVVHRDLKPANIVLGDFGEVYVLDWGIARVVDEPVPAARPSFPDLQLLGDEATSIGAMIGTPGYMPPEQIQGEADVDARADIYALGCVLFELLARSALHPRGREGIGSALAGDVDARPSVRAPGLDIAPEL
ncbi:MAG: serine/threonine protein kinase, partial [Deltaproteobacteria bacterium]|nr:serine/threonine protein kinase [Deltaproteobacteria bacterium]